MIIANTEKVLALKKMAEAIEEQQRLGRKIVHCHGVFDLLHPGHIRHLKAAKAEGDILVVTITPDKWVNKGPGRPVYNQQLRLETLAALEVVDYVALNHWPSAVETIKLLKPDVFVKGSEFKDRGADVTGNVSAEEQAITEYGGRLHLTDDLTMSSTKLLNSFFSALPPESAEFLRRFREQNSPDDVVKRIRALSNLRVLVIGDAIIDEYQFCKPLGQASKSIAINARYLATESHAGGALAIANHVSGFVRHVHLVSCLGEESTHQDTIATRLRPNISTKFFLRPGAPTTLKRRFTTEFLFQKLFEISFLEDKPLPLTIEHTVTSYLNDVIRDFDLVIVADFGHGLLGPSLINVLCNSARFMALNTQTNSANNGFNLATKYPRADYLCLDEEELRLACHDKYGDAEDLSGRIAERLETTILAITRGHRGSLALHRNGGRAFAPIFSTSVVDTTGAGDAYLSVTSLCAVADYPIEFLTFIGNCTGALAVRELGNRCPVDAVPLFRFVTALLK